MTDAERLQKFRTVGEDRVQAIVGAVEAIRDLNADARAQVSQSLMRELHTLKGEAKMLQLETIGDIAHRVEDLVSAARAAAFEDWAPVSEAVIQGMDLVARFLESDLGVSSGSAEEAQRFAAQSQGLLRADALETADAPSEEDDREEYEEMNPAIIRVFISECTAWFAALEQSLMALEGRPKDVDILDEIFRILHTVKGSAAMVHLDRMSDLGHAMEDALEVIRDGKMEYVGTVVDTFLAALDGLKAMPHLPKLGQRSDYSEVIGHLGEIARCKAPAKAAPQVVEAVTPAAVQQAPAPGKTDVLRVPAHRLLKLTELSGELTLRHAQFEQMIEDVRRIAEDWTHSVGALQRLAQEMRRDGSGSNALLRMLESEHSLPRLTALAKESMRLIGTMSDEGFDTRFRLRALQDELSDLRLLDVKKLFSGVPRTVRDISRSLGKQITVLVESEDIGVDKQVLDGLEGPLVHLVRNSCDHGFEDPETRERLRKPPTGTLKIEARQAGADVEISISDDGGGINADVVRAKAVEKGLITAQDAGRLSNGDVYAFLFDSGFSTRTEVTELSGRGVGLDVVKKDVESMGGSVRVESEFGKGTRFTLRVPVSTAVVSSLMVRIPEGLYAIPSSAVWRVASVAQDALEEAGNGFAVRLDNETPIPCVSLTSLLGFEKGYGQREHLTLVVLSMQRQMLAVEVDRVVGQRYFVQRKLTGLLEGLHVLTGCAMVEGGHLALFVSVPALFSGLERARSRNHGARTSERVEERCILVVEDSELTRDMLVSVLTGMGYVVDEAVNGLDALEKLRANRVDAVLTDLDMPLLDGFGLIDAMSEDPKLRDIPAIVISTRDSTADRMHAQEAGASGFLSKSQFQERTLRETLEGLWARAVA